MSFFVRKTNGSRYIVLLAIYASHTYEVMLKHAVFLVLRSVLISHFQITSRFDSVFIVDPQFSWTNLRKMFTLSDYNTYV